MHKRGSEISRTCHSQNEVMALSQTHAILAQFFTSLEVRFLVFRRLKHREEKLIIFFSDVVIKMSCIDFNKQIKNICYLILYIHLKLQ